MLVDRIEKIKIIIFTILYAFIYIFVFPIWFILDYLFFLPTGLLFSLLENMIEDSFWLSGLIFTGILCFFFFRYISEFKQCRYEQVLKQNIIIITIGTPLYWFFISVVFTINQNISFNIFYIILISLLCITLIFNYVQQCEKH